jgi:alpha-ketoglutaric semialdehyde dehydrogenase
VDDILVEAVNLGATGWIAGLVNAFPAESVELFNLAIAGKKDEAFALYRWFLPLLRMDTVPKFKFVQLIKWVQSETGTGSHQLQGRPLIAGSVASIKAVAFTGSFRGGRALMDFAAKREIPIPVYAEMGSTNPVFILPGALAERGEALAKGLHGSFTLGGGQFCTKPGLVFATESPAFLNTLRNSVESSPAFSLLTEGIATTFNKSVHDRAPLQTAQGSAAGKGFSAQVSLLETTAQTFLADHSLSEELFGPTTLLIHYSSRDQILEAARTLGGHLTATVLGTEEDLADNIDLLRILETKVGRVIFNAFPTGVEVNHAMVHGGPYPATSDGRSTSVGSQAIFRFARPVSYQGLPQSALHPALQDSNPLGILRLVNGAWQTA